MAGLQLARPRLAKVARLLTADTLTEDARQKYCQELAIDPGMIKDEMRLYDAPGLPVNICITTCSIRSAKLTLPHPLPQPPGGCA